MVCGFELGCLKMVVRIPGGIGPERGSCRTRRWQQQRDQIRRTLKEPVEPVIGFQNQPHCHQPALPISITTQYACTAVRILRGFTGIPPSACGGCSLAPPPWRQTLNPAARAAAPPQTAAKGSPDGCHTPSPSDPTRSSTPRSAAICSALTLGSKIASWAPCVVLPNRSACLHGFADSSSAAARVGFHQSECSNPVHSAAFQTQPAPHDTIVFSTDYLHSRCAQR